MVLRMLCNVVLSDISNELAAQLQRIAILALDTYLASDEMNISPRTEEAYAG